MDHIGTLSQGFYFPKTIGSIPTIIAKVFLKGFIYLGDIYEKLINMNKLIKNRYKNSIEDGTISLVDKVVGSSLSYTLVQFAGGLLLILIIVLMFMN